MFDWLRSWLLDFLRVPEAPAAPLGSPESVRVFRAGRNFYKWSLIKWGLKQTAAAVGLAVALTFFGPFQTVGIPPSRFPAAARMVWVGLESLAVTLFLVQLPITYAMQRLGFEMRWYIVTDRSLRIRSGIWNVEELTITFANIQRINLGKVRCSDGSDRRSGL